MKILCVDDDSIARKIYERGLAQKVPEDSILLAESAKDARSILANEHIDLVITDLVMPGETGIELLQYVMDHSAWTEVILVTGQASVETAVEAMRLGARDYIEKPIDVSLLHEKLEKIREYQRRASEVEDYRLAKEAVEREAAQDVFMLEERLEKMRLLVRSARKILAEESTGSVESRLAELKELLQSRY